MKDKISGHVLQILKDIKTGKQELNYEWYQTKSFPSQWVLQCSIITNNHPIGLLWADHSLKRGILISNIYVEDIYRRIGIATRLLEQLWSWDGTKLIFTHSGNKLSNPWMKKCGFIKDEIIGLKLTKKNWLKSKAFKLSKKYFSQ